MLDFVVLLLLRFHGLRQRPVCTETVTLVVANHGVSVDLGGLGINVLDDVSFARASRFVEKARVGRDRMLRIEDRSTDTTIRREIGQLLKLDV